jgi:quinoprotein glucose dehydrogenase
MKVTCELWKSPAVYWCVPTLTLLSLALVAQSGDEWPAYGRDPGGNRFSPLAAINRKNVAELRIAWTFRTGDAYQPPRGRSTAFEATPIYVEGTLYLGTPLGRVIALDPVTGQQRWAYDSDAKANKDKGYGDFANRGVSTWKPPSGPRRIFIATIDARLIAVDAVTGKPIGGFGDNGVVNLRNGLRIPPRDFADYEETSPPAVIGSIIVVGSGIADNGSVGSAKP